MSTSLPVVRSALRTFAIYGVYIGASILFVIPFVWALSGSLKNPYQLELFPPEWIPDPVLWRNYAEIWTIVPLGRFMWNTLFIAVLSLAGQLFTASMVAYGFAKFRFPGRDVLFLLMLSTLMLPIHVSLIPRFVLFYKLQWVDTFLPLIVPNYFGGSAFAIFLLRQFFRNLPKEMDDAARIDGAGYWRILLSDSAAPVPLRVDRADDPRLPGGLGRIFCSRSSTCSPRKSSRSPSDSASWP